MHSRCQEIRAQKNSSHLKPDAVMKKLTAAGRGHANLLINTGPLPDGSIHPTDISTLREVGRRLRAAETPKGTAAPEPTASRR